MSTVATLNAKLDLQNAGFKKGLNDSASALSGFGSKLAGIAKGIGAIGALATIAGAAVAAKFIAPGIGMASAWNETMSKSSVIFGEQSDAMIDWAENGAQAFGTNKQMALETAATFGNLFEGMGVGQKEAAGMSKGIVELAADLASFNNLPTDQVLADLQSGLVGQAEPLRKYGILIDEASVNAKALEMGLADANGEVSQQNKLLARNALIFEQTKRAQGDFARTSDGFANSSRILRARLQNLQMQIGGKLLPTLNKGVDAANRFLSRFDAKRAQGFGIWEAGLSSLHTTLDQIFGKSAGDKMIAVISGIGDVIDNVGGAIGRLGGALLSGDIGGFFTELVNDAKTIASEGFDLGKVVVTATFDLITNAAGDLWQWVVDQVMGVGDGPMGPMIGAPVGKTGPGAHAHDIPFGTVLVTAALKLWEGILEGASDLWGWVQNKLGAGSGSRFSGKFGGLGGGGNAPISVGDVLIDAALDLGGELKSLADDAQGWIVKNLHLVGDQVYQIGKITLQGDVVITDGAGGDGTEAGKSFASRVGNGIRDGIVDFLKTFTSLGEMVRHGVENIFRNTDWGSVGKVVAAAIAAGLVLSPIGFTLAIATGLQAILGGAIAAFVKGFVFPDTSLGELKDKLLGGIRKAFDSLFGGPELTGFGASGPEFEGGGIFSGFIKSFKASVVVLKDALTFDLSEIPTPPLPDWLTSMDWLNTPLDALKKTWAEIVKFKNLIFGTADDQPFKSPTFGNRFTTPPSNQPGEVGGELVTTLPSVGAGPMSGITTKLDLDKTAFDTAMNNAIQAGLGLQATTFTSKLDADTGPAAIAYTDVMGWGGIWQAALFKSTFDIDIGPAAVAYTTAFGFGNVWASQVFTARFAIDTSGLDQAVVAAQSAAAQIAALLPHSLAKKGPLSEPVNFGFIAESLTASMMRMPAIADRGLSRMRSRLENVSVPGMRMAGSGSRSASQSGRPIIVQLNAPVYGVDNFKAHVAESVSTALVQAAADHARGHG